MSISDYDRASQALGTGIKPTAAGTGTELGVATGTSLALSGAAGATEFDLVHMTSKSTTPTVSGFGTSPSVVASNGTAAFTINVGTGGAASTGTITLPAAATGWVLTGCHDVTTPDSFITRQTGGSTTTITVTNYSATTGLAIAWTASDILRCAAVAY